jgi:hypothetical protein
MISHTIKTSCIAITTVAVFSCGGGEQAVIGDQSSDAPSTDNHTDTHIAYTQVEAGVWPPQPVGISNAQGYVNENPRPAIRDIKTATALDLAMQNIDVLRAIGSRFELLGSYTSGEKSTSKQSTEIELFNYDSNEVVTVKIDTGNIITVNQTPASDYQPAETSDESSRAIAMAADYLQSLGHDTGQLTGAALLTHPTAAQVAASGKQFHEHRLIYVTFGHGAGTTPLYRATVDLSDQIVIKGGRL